VHVLNSPRKLGKGSLKGIWFSSSFISGVDVGFVRFREHLSSFDGYLEAESQAVFKWIALVNSRQFPSKDEVHH